MSELVLSLQGISKSFSVKQVLKSIDFSVDQGTIIGLMGKNGAGKSTLIKCLLGLLQPDKGKAEIFGEESWNMSVATKHRIGYVPQILTGFRWMCVETMLDYTGSFYKYWNKSKVISLLKKWDLDPWSKISSLSVGERQKVAIIQAMGHEPDVFIFDEPVASLDPVARREFIRQLIDLNMNENKTMLFSTHISSDLERVAADIALLKDGVISFIGDLSELKERVKRLHIRSFKKLPQSLPFKNIISSQINHGSAVVTVDGISEDELRAFKEKYEATITVEQLNLEDIFLELNQ
jgi:ABC-2 type transport system ATP-binding protein